MPGVLHSELAPCRCVLGCLGLAAALACLMTAGPSTSFAQDAFQIVWVVIGEAATPHGNGSTRAGKQLFTAADLLPFSMRNVKVARVEVQPVVVNVGMNERTCVSSLHVRAFDPAGKPIVDAPLSVTVRQDHRDRLQLIRSKRDICMQPTEPGEYPVRFTSLLPAPDGTTRGAQVFIRVS